MVDGWTTTLTVQTEINLGIKNMETTIKRIDNGWVVTQPNEDSELEDVVVVFEAYGSSKEDQKRFKTKDEDKIALGRMLYHLAETVGYCDYDKYKKENLEINFSKKGHRYYDTRTQVPVLGMLETKEVEEQHVLPEVQKPDDETTLPTAGNLE